LPSSFRYVITTSEDGLAHSIVGAIFQDRKGYIWFGTAGGLSRFDGYRFTNYGKDDGLPSAVVTAITEDAKGQLWIGTTGGIARLIDDPNEGSPAKQTHPQTRGRSLSLIGSERQTIPTRLVRFFLIRTARCGARQMKSTTRRLTRTANSSLKLRSRTMAVGPAFAALSIRADVCGSGGSL